MWDERSTAKRFEDRVHATLKRTYTRKAGWRLERYAKLGAGDRADFLLVNSRTGQILVIDAKYKTALTTSDLRQLAAYRKKAKAERAVFYVPRNIKITESMAKTLARRKLDVHKTSLTIEKPWL